MARHAGSGRIGQTAGKSTEMHGTKWDKNCGRTRRREAEKIMIPFHLGPPSMKLNNPQYPTATRKSVRLFPLTVHNLTRFSIKAIAAWRGRTRARRPSHWIRQTKPRFLVRQALEQWSAPAVLSVGETVCRIAVRGGARVIGGDRGIGKRSHALDRYSPLPKPKSRRAARRTASRLGDSRHLLRAIRRSKLEWAARDQ